MLANRLRNWLAKLWGSKNGSLIFPDGAWNDALRLIDSLYRPIEHLEFSLRKLNSTNKIMISHKQIPQEKLKSFCRALNAQETRVQNEYKLLEKIFIHLRCRVSMQLKESLRKLSKKEKSHHPAFQPISLLRVLDGTGLKETAHTRILAWLLQPSDDFGFKQAPIRSLLKHLAVIGFPYSTKCILSDIEIEAEHALSDKSGKRIDIWIEGSVRKNRNSDPTKWLIIVEAKIEADETWDQLPSYEVEAKHWESRTKKAGLNYCKPILIYLTREGKAAKMGIRNWHPVSFETISGLIWHAIKDCETSPGFHLARYYIAGVLSDVCEWPIPLPSNHKNQGGILENQYGMLDFFRKIS